MALPAFVAAKLPVTKNHEIVLGKSVGGVNLGTKKGQAIAKWGSKPRCLPPDESGVETCLWEPPNGMGDGGFINVWNTKVITVGVSATTIGTQTPYALNVLSSFKTAKGIHIGSSKTAAESKYPGMKVPKGEAGAPFLYLCKAACTVFGGLGPKIERISVTSNEEYR
ncbi:MAG: hypothetical protein ACHQCF_02450 [Solirubrobacterales bacterium]